ncbi:ribosomal protein S6 kinase delta-1 isoform X1 [Nilaparvata lugens]|uniref:ribosomal protein S6 kinase delta-1 isoform X1 n=1 Tax=Nilaparvata lugens TaxID=108931 RepID=UPI00193E2E5B|nr:ribosomal protein S6 kinase delta-1 isoform X1 [Nilaparvata lugens]
MALKDDTWVRRFIVSDPVKHKKGFTLYKITSIVFPKKHPEAVTKIIVWKRYNDFKKLHKELKLKYQKLQLPDKFPPFVKAKFFRRFEDDVIEERRQAALVLLDFVAQHSALFTSETFVKFFQCGYSVNNTTGSIDKIEPCYNTLIQPWALEDPFHPAAIFSGPIRKDENAVTNSEDDITSFTTDTDSAISSPLQSEDIAWGVDDNSPVHRACLPPPACKIFSPSLERELTADNGSCSYLQVDDFSTIDQGGTSKSKELRKEISLAELWRPIDELRFYKVLAVYTKVMLVIDTRNDSLHVIKGLQKSPYPMLKDRGTVLPGVIPYMVQLHALVETASFVYLVMQHVSSGKLWDYVTPYFPKYAPKICTRNTSPVDEDPKSLSVSQHTVTNSASKTTTTIHQSRSSSSASSIELDSYIDLIKDYTSAKKGNLDDRKRVTNSVSSDDMVKSDKSSLYEQILNYSKSENALNTVVDRDDPLYQITDDLTLFNLVADRLESGKTSSELAEKWGKLTAEGQVDSSLEKVVGLDSSHDSVGKMKSSKSNAKDQVDSSIEKVVGLDSIHDSAGMMKSSKSNAEDQIESSVEKVVSLDSSHDSVGKIKSSKSNTEDQIHSSVEKVVGLDSSNDSVGKMKSSKSNAKDQVDSSIEKVVGLDSIHDSAGMMKSSKSNAEDQIESSVEKVVSLDSSHDSVGKIKSSKSNTNLNVVDSVVESPISCSSKESKFICDVLACDDSVRDDNTASLVENAKRLLRSVDETLSKSESLMVRVKQDMMLKESASAIISSSSSSSFENIIVHADDDVDDMVRSIPESPSSLRHLKAFDMTRLHPGSPYSRGGSPVSSVSTDPEAHWWKLEEEGRGLREDTVRRWAAQLFTALSSLHDLGIICRDLNPDNLLVHKGCVKLTYFCQFAGVEPPVQSRAIAQLFCAPEVTHPTGLLAVTQAADWWSFGAILYQLLTGQSLASCHPGGFHCHTILYIPNEALSKPAASILNQLLQFNPSERLCCREEIQAHPFFSGIDWVQIHNEGLTAD